MKVLWTGERMKLVLAPMIRLPKTSIGGNEPPVVFITLKATPLVRRGQHVLHVVTAKQPDPEHFGKGVTWGKLTKKRTRELIERAKEIENGGE